VRAVKPLDMSETLALLTAARIRALQTRCEAVRKGAKRRVQAYRFVHDLDWYKARLARRS
jgi:hypothetical protein